MQQYDSKDGLTDNEFNFRVENKKAKPKIMKISQIRDIFTTDFKNKANIKQ